jgi:DNA mismatch endonuclease, patch repair protein
MTKDYLRDGRAPIPSSENISKAMRGNQGKNTKPELILRKALREAGLGGYRLHWKMVAGRPDISYPSKRIAIFVNGCFWHRCSVCDLALPKTHREFWENKLEKNAIRDKNKQIALKEAGWTVFIFWEHEIKSDVKQCVNLVQEELRSSY